MNARKLFALMLTGMIFSILSPVRAQEKENNERSKIVETFNGKPYYIHFVKDGQTVYTISRMYGVTTEELNANNPELKAGLKTDMILKIPYKDTIVVEQKQRASLPFKKKPTEPDPAVGAEEKQTVERVAAAISAAAKNKKSDNLQQGKPSADQPPQSDKGNASIVYEIKRGETLYGIAKRYNVTMDEILNLNPGVTSFRAGTKIHIPAAKSAAAPAAGQPAGVKQAVTPAKTVGGEAVSKPSYSDLSERSGSGALKVALLIPLYLEEMDSIRVDQAEPKSFSFVQFYEASLIAVDSLRKQGLDAKLFVYDADGDESTDKTKAIFQKKELAEMDLIIGPFYAKCFDIASKFAAAHKIPIVNPLSKRNEIITGKPWVIKAQPDNVGEMAEVAAFIGQRYPGANVVVVRADRTKMNEETTAFKSVIQMEQRKQSKLSGVKESFFSSEGAPGLKLKLSTEKPNVLMVFSSDEVFVSNLINNLDELTNGYNMTVIGMASWEAFKLDINAMQHLKVHIYSNKTVDFFSPQVAQFSARFLAEYHTVPEIKKYGFDGFDITYYFLSALMKYGRNFEKQLDGYSYRGMQDSFRFHKVEGGGFENTAVNFFKVENNNLQRVQ